MGSVERPLRSPAGAFGASGFARDAGGRIAAVLGPTNTGKTHFAIERMLGHSSGMIGLPLRLLAREIYDRVVKAKGPTRTALITGEEKIVPPNAAYFVCTVESMPVDRDVAFLAVDEIQLAADPERGHVFTDRLLHARGRDETLLLGSESIRPLLKKLIPDAEFITRPRFSTLSFAGSKKISRLPRRSAIVAFSASAVYAIAETVRRQKGGAAVVMGALSPRTRNAQVALYEAGEVDYLVATDAIGMGLNMAINHVAFAALTKFDGRVERALTAAEIAQIAGRAGRHMNDGSFGLISGTDDEAQSLTPEIVEQIENHRFAPLRRIEWRNTALDYRSLSTLIRSLEEKAPFPFLSQSREADDLTVLRALSRDETVKELATGPAAVALLWQVCQIPDFRKTMSDAHASLVGEIYGLLMRHEGVLPTDWIARQVTRLDNCQGDIDTLAARLAHIRTWTYVAHRGGWLDDAKRWQERTRDIEDRLSDALHERLSQRFIDRRASMLIRRKRAEDDLAATVEDDGAVSIGGHFVGRLKGFRFEPDGEARGEESRALANAAEKALKAEIVRRAKRLAKASYEDFALENHSEGAFQPLLCWNGEPIARVAPGKDLLAPRAALLPFSLLEGTAAASVQARLDGWLDEHIGRLLAPLVALQHLIDAPAKGEALLGGAARGVAFALIESLGSIPRRAVAPLLRTLPKADRRRLQRLSVVFGEASLYSPPLLKPKVRALRAALFLLATGADVVPPLPRPQDISTSAEAGIPASFYEAIGFRTIGERAIRVDMLERAAKTLRKAAKGGAFDVPPELPSLAGCTDDALRAVLKELGYARAPGKDGERYEMRKRAARRPNRRKEDAAAAKHSPFAQLADLAKPSKRR